MVTFQRAVDLYFLKAMGNKLSERERAELEEYENRFVNDESCI